MDELILTLVTCLTAATVFATIEYYRYVRRAQNEFEKAKMAVEDIVLSFNRQFKREGEKLEIVAYKVETIASKAGSTLDIAKGAEKRMSDLEAKVQTESDARTAAISRLDIVEKNLRDLATSQDALEVKLSDLEQKAAQLPAVAEASLEAAIPIRKDKAIAQLTETELSALEFLASEGSKTAPEIKDYVKLSREHTARLMKKLYEQGYLERETAKIPFKYSVKKEMEKFLRKPESQTP
jgi:dGTP triphosphohydrolase